MEVGEVLWFRHLLRYVRLSWRYWILQTWNNLWPKKVCGMTQSLNFVPRCFLSCMPCACRKRWFNTLKDIPNVPRREYKLSYSYWALNGRSTASSDAVACLWRINVWHISGARETMEIRGMQLLPSRFWGDKMGEDETFGLLDQDNGGCTREKRQTTENSRSKTCRIPSAGFRAIWEAWRHLLNSKPCDQWTVAVEWLSSFALSFLDSVFGQTHANLRPQSN